MFWNLPKGGTIFTLTPRPPCVHLWSYCIFIWMTLYLIWLLFCFYFQLTQVERQFYCTSNFKMSLLERSKSSNSISKSKQTKFGYRSIKPLTKVTIESSASLANQIMVKPVVATPESDKRQSKESSSIEVIDNKMSSNKFRSNSMSSNSKSSNSMLKCNGICQQWFKKEDVKDQNGSSTFWKCYDCKTGKYNYLLLFTVY